MITTIQKWGNSQGLRLSKTLLADAALDVGDSDGALRLADPRRATLAA